MYLHRKGQFLDFNGRMGHKVDLGQRARMQVAYQDIRTINKVRANSMLVEKYRVSHMVVYLLLLTSN